MARVFVTGADGFIGSHLVEELVRRGHEVRALVLYNSEDRRGWLDSTGLDCQRDIEVIAGDVRDGPAMRRAVSGCDCVLHLAALIAIPYSYVAAQSYVQTNVEGTLNLLEAARDQGVARFIHTSTSEVYGTARFVPITEEHPLQPQSPYSATKIAADSLAYSYFASFGLPVTIVRPFNNYGPRQSTRAVIPTIITQIASGERRVKLGARHPTRDFMFVEDTAAGFVAAMSGSTGGMTINLGSGFEISIGDTANLIAKTMGVDIEIVDEATRLRPPGSEVERLWADTSRANSLLGWQPNYGGLEGFTRGLAKTIAWYAKPENLARFRAGTYTI